MKYFKSCEQLITLVLVSPEGHCFLTSPKAITTAFCTSIIKAILSFKVEEGEFLVLECQSNMHQSIRRGKKVAAVIYMKSLLY